MDDGSSSSFGYVHNSVLRFEKKRRLGCSTLGVEIGDGATVMCFFFFRSFFSFLFPSIE